MKFVQNIANCNSRHLFRTLILDLDPLASVTKMGAEVYYMTIRYWTKLLNGFQGYHMEALTEWIHPLGLELRGMRKNMPCIKSQKTPAKNYFAKKSEIKWKAKPKSIISSLPKRFFVESLNNWKSIFCLLLYKVNEYILL